MKRFFTERMCGGHTRLIPRLKAIHIKMSFKMIINSLACEREDEKRKEIQWISDQREREGADESWPATSPEACILTM